MGDDFHMGADNFRYISMKKVAPS